MSLILDLPPDLETELTAEAARLGIPLAEYILRLIAMCRGAESLPRTGAELLAYWQSKGLVGARSDITDSQAHACKLREQAEKRPRS
jgi:hypothetical protein